MSAPESPFPFAARPTKTYTGRSYPMYLNGDGIQVIHMPAAHSDGDSIVFFRRADVIVSGDILDTTRFPGIDVAKGGSIQGEIDALNRLLEMMIPPFPLRWRDDRTYRDPWTWLRRRLRRRGRVPERGDDRSRPDRRT